MPDGMFCRLRVPASETEMPNNSGVKLIKYGTAVVFYMNVPKRVRLICHTLYALLQLLNAVLGINTRYIERRMP